MAKPPRLRGTSRCGAVVAYHLAKVRVASSNLVICSGTVHKSLAVSEEIIGVPLSLTAGTRDLRLGFVDSGLDRQTVAIGLCCFRYRDTALYPNWQRIPA